MAAPKGNKFAKGNKTSGRPSKFKDSYCDEMIKFFDIQAYTQVVAEELKEYYANGSIKKEGKKYKQLPAKMPTLHRFARHIKVDYSTVYRWAEKGEWDGLDKEGNPTPIDPKFEVFCNTYKASREMIKEFLNDLALAGITPSGSFKFIATNYTDMRDKQETEVTHKGSIIYLPPKKDK